MKYLKMLGLVAIAAAALMAVAGSGTASATVLCHTTSTPCAQKWAANTQVEFTLGSGSSGEWMRTGGELITTCTEGQIKGKISNAGSESATVKIPVAASDFIWPKCTSTSETLAGGEFEIHAIAGTDNGTVTASGFNFTTTVTGISCSFYFPEGTIYGTLTASGSGNANIDINTVLSKKEGSFLCPSSLQWVEGFRQTAPSGTALFVEPS
jgi:hypothetical protein